MWYSRTIEEVLQDFGVNPDQGLLADDADTRLKTLGENRLAGKPPKGLTLLFLEQINNMLIYVLLAAAVITTAIHEYADSAIILMVVVLNAVIGVVQEYKAEKALEALRRMATPRALVRRDGCVKDIGSEGIVPGDIVILEAGRLIPADLRLIKSFNLSVDESSLTGESVAVEKNALNVFADGSIPLGDRSNMAFMSTLATSGHGEGVVVATAMATEIGTIARMLDEDHTLMTPLQRRMARLGRNLGFIAIGICIVIFAIAVLQQRDLIDALLTAISLAVAVIPEGLPAIVAIVLALGVRDMSRNNAIVKRLPAVETLGSVNIICSDKTGTLTQNRMTVVKLCTLYNPVQIPEVGDGLVATRDQEELLRTFVLCSDATYDNGISTGDPTEIALVIAGGRYNLERNTLNAKYRRIGEKPFDSSRKLMSTLNEEGTGYRVHTKGAIDHILMISNRVLVNGQVLPLNEDIKAQFLKAADEMSDQALRVLGAAYKDSEYILSPDEMEDDLTVIGLVGMIDPPRLEVKGSIDIAKMAGITPVMITGDYKNTALAIARQLGIAESPQQCITGVEIDQLAEEELVRRIGNYRVFARVTPEHKVKIVQALKATGNIVSMTGDGINDAPSLKNADIGVAMGITGTDVAKGASDMILTDDNFATIVNAIEEGRNIYNNIKKAVNFLLSCNLGEIIVIFTAVIFQWPIPLVPTQILWVNLITDTLPAFALGVDSRDKNVMKQKPRDPSESFFALGAGLRIVIGGGLIGMVTLAAFYLGLAEFAYGLVSKDVSGDAIDYARTMAFVVLSTSQLFYSLSARDSGRFIIEIGVFSNMKLICAIGIGLLLQVLIISNPLLAAAFKVQRLAWTDWGLAIGLALVPLVINEGAKGIRRLLSH